MWVDENRLASFLTTSTLCLCRHAFVRTATVQALRKGTISSSKSSFLVPTYQLALAALTSACETQSGRVCLSGQDLHTDEPTRAKGVKDSLPAVRIYLAHNPMEQSRASHHRSNGKCNHVTTTRGSD